MRRWGSATPPPPQEGERKPRFLGVRRAVFRWGGLRPPQRKTLFEGCGAARHSPQTAIIELTFLKDGVG